MQKHNQGIVLNKSSQKMPLTPNKKAKNIAEAIESSTSNTWAALSDKGKSNEREILADQVIVNAAAALTVKDTKSRQSLLSHLNQGNKKVFCERLEPTRSYVYYQSHNGFNAKLQFETLSRPILTEQVEECWA